MLAIAVIATAAFGLAGDSGDSETQLGSRASTVTELYPTVHFQDDVPYGPLDEERLDVCSPATRSSLLQADSPQARPAILSIHGGGWRAGDKQDAPWRDSCGWLASEGFVVFQVNYRLAPLHPFPAAIDDVNVALRWILDPRQVAAYNIDPTRVGAFGDSAGGNLAALLATDGARQNVHLKAIAAVSAPMDLTEAGTRLGRLGDGFVQLQLDYLGCDFYSDCPHARQASPIYFLDPGDPPFLIVHATGDTLVPIEQAEAMRDALRSASVDVTFRPKSGSKHALSLLDASVRSDIAKWFAMHLRGG